MRDAFGGVFMMRLMLVFIVVFVGFGAVSLNYAKAFRIKNRVIDVIEQLEITDVESILSSTKNYTDKLDSIIDDANYTITCDNTGSKQLTIKDDTDKVIGICYRGINITINNEHKKTNYIYYNVTAYGGWNLGFLNMLLVLGGEDQNSESPLSGRWAITGEAKVRKINDDSAPYTIPITSDNGWRCHRTKKWIRILACQPDYVINPKCMVDDGTTVLRSDLSTGAYCPGINKPTT